MHKTDTPEKVASTAELGLVPDREDVDDALLIVGSYGPWGADLNDAHRRQIVLADEVLRLRRLYKMAVQGRSEMRTALRQERDPLEARYMALVKAVADGVALQPPPMMIMTPELSKDAERLDWLERQYLEDLSMQLVVDAEHDGQYYVCGDSSKPGYGPNLRAAIDAAMLAG